MSNPQRLGDEKCIHHLAAKRAVQMGIVNVTPDSFSDGGLLNSPEKALEHSLALVSAGAHIIDIGGVSTRPGSLSVDDVSEWQRVCDVLKVLRLNLPSETLISLDTRSPRVAFWAASLGLVDLINDVSAAQIPAAANEDSIADMPTVPGHWTTAHVAAHFNLGLALMHMQGEPGTMQSNPHYGDCVAEVFAYLKDRLAFATELGVRWCSVDPGIGFGKTLDHNLSLLSEKAFTKFNSLGVPLMIGLSRKSFLKALTEREGSLPVFSSPEDERHWRDQQSALWEKSCVRWGAKIIRTHTIKDLY